MGNWRTLICLAGALMVAGCGGKKTIPQGFSGTYKIPDSHMDHSTYFKELTLVPTGATFKNVSVIGSESITFKSVSCDSETSCRFTTENRCDGSLTKQPDGSVVVTATFVCDTLAGNWLGDDAAKKAMDELSQKEGVAKVEDDKKMAAARARAARSTGATGGVGAAGCLAQCTADTLSCQQACKSDDIGCKAQCSATGAKCVDGCPK